MLHGWRLRGWKLSGWRLSGGSGFGRFQGLDRARGSQRFRFLWGMGDFQVFWELASVVGLQSVGGL
jgi:hypothetical protein